MTLSTRQILETLIGFDTTSRNSNLELIHWIADYLDGLGIASELTHDDDGQKANLFATVGPPDVRGICLSGHTDVVPVDGQDWSSPPFAVDERDGRLYGRGTSDMKSFIAVALAAVPEMLARGLKTPVHLAFSYDEEIGCLGVRRLIAALDRAPVRPKGCIIGEPTSMKVVNGHKGKLSCECRVIGAESHSAHTDKGVNAIEAAAAIVNRLAETGRKLREEGPHDENYDPPYTTVQTGVIQGGTALNIVPGECVFEFEFRNLPLEDPEPLYTDLQAWADAEILPGMQAVNGMAGFVWRETSAYPGLAGNEDSEVVQLAKALTGDNAPSTVSFGTEGGLFEQAGIPAVVCGPGSILQAHKPDEYVELAQIASCETFVARLIDRLS